MPDCVVGRNAGGVAQTLFLGPPEGREGEVLLGDGASDMNANPGQRGELLILQEVPYRMSGGVIENETACSVLGTMLGEKDHGMLE